MSKFARSQLLRASSRIADTQPRTIPRTAPHSVIAKPQERNTLRTPLRVAPMAVNTPMSRVFSVTIIDSVANIRNAALAQGHHAEVAEGAAEQARESHRITQARYEAGLTSVTDLLRSQNALLEAEAGHLNALYNAKLAEVDLARSTGTLDKDSEAIR